MGGVQGNRGESTRLGSRDITAWVKSWKNRISIDLKTINTSVLTEGKDREYCGISINGEDNLLLDIQDLNITLGELKLLAKNQEAVKSYVKQFEILKEIAKEEFKAQVV